MLTSVHNPQIQAVSKLQALARERRAEQKFVIEGVRLVEEALQAGWKAHQLYHTEILDSRGKRVVDGFTKQGVTVETVSSTVMKAISDTESPQGILAVMKQQDIPLPSRPGFVLILDAVRDPGNLGTILRTAAAAGVELVILTPGSVDAWSPKVLRSGMGAHFRLPVRSMNWQDIRHTLESPPQLKTFLADAAGEIEYTQADFRSPLALIVGGEAAGAGTEATSLAAGKVHIPMPGGSESLNAAVAASILLFEVVRQRCLEGTK